MLSTTERESTVETEGMGPGAELTLGPAWLYPLKAGVTRARSLAWRVRAAPNGGRGTRILFYHRVADADDVLAVRPRRFAEQMAVVAELGLRCVDVATLGASFARGETPQDVVGLSFDDGYLDVAEHAAPVLERHGFAASVFVATAVTDGHASFTWYAQQPPLIGWDAMRELDGGSPLRFEAHTRTHPNLLRLDDARAREEVAGGKTELEQRLGRPVEAFCYPAGLYGPRERRFVEDAGFTTAVSCEPGVNTAATDPLALRRIQVDRSDRLLDFRAKLLGGHDTPLPLRRAWRRLRLGAS